MSACSASRCELTETYSPAAIDSAPATSPAIPAVTIAVPDAPEAATPSTRLAVDTMPSLAPSTAARSQLERWLRWTSEPIVEALTQARLLLRPARRLGHRDASRTRSARGKTATVGVIATVPRRPFAGRCWAGDRHRNHETHRRAPLAPGALAPGRERPASPWVSD